MSNTHNVKILNFIAINSIAIIILLILSVTTPNITSATAPEALKWTRENIPTEGATGDWVLASGSDIQHLTAAIDGTLYAFYIKGSSLALYKSIDKGLKWSCASNVADAITGIAVSPKDVKTIYYATASSVYRSTDGGKNFTALPALPSGVGSGNNKITSLAVTWLNGNIIAAGTADTDSSQYGGIYMITEEDFIPSWTDTNVGNYDTYALGFSPNYARDRQLIAVTSNETDTFIFNKIGNARWNAFADAVKLNRDNSHTPVSVVAAGAVIAFPGNFHTGAATGNSLYVGIDTSTSKGDVFKIDSADVSEPLTATALNCGRAYGLMNTDIAGLTVYGDERNSILLAGSAQNSRIYISKDGGRSWIKSKKEPTGGSRTEVIMAPDFALSGLIYAITSGGNSALSVSRDIGVSWNQISLIDTVINNIKYFAPSPRSDENETMFMITSGTGQSLWRSINDGANWERLLATNSTGINKLDLITLPPKYGADCLTVYVYGEINSNPVILASNDNGQTFLHRFTCDPVTGAAFKIDNNDCNNAWAIYDENTFFAGSFDGSQGKIYRTTNGGNSYSAGMPVGTYSLNSLALSPDFSRDGSMLVGNTGGWVYFSSDNGSSFQPLPANATSPSLDGNATAAFDPDFKTNRTVYAASATTDSGIYRFIIGRSQTWERIDSTLPTSAVISQLALMANGTLYAANSNSDGGLERCLNPKATSNSTFETVTRGLSNGATLSGLWQNNGRIWSLDNHNISDVKLLTYYDTLALPTKQTSPASGVSGIGSLINHSIANIVINWETMDGATSYEWQCNYDADFSNVPADLSGTTTASSVHLPALQPATTYYWRVRARGPVFSPWSLKRSFTTSMDTEEVNLKPEVPSPGATDVDIKPVFQWTAVLGADAYELLVATDADFTHPVITKLNQYALKTNAWNCDVSLDYRTVYYWKIRATTASTCSAWSSVGIFTTASQFSVNRQTPLITPTTTQLITQELLAIRSTPTPTIVTSSPTSAPFAPTTSAVADRLLEMPVWLIYFIGGLFAIVFLSLIIVLVVVLKINRY